MRVGFLSDPLVTSRNGQRVKVSPLSLLADPLAWRASAPGGSGDLYAGIVELDATQVTALLDAATAASCNLALVVDITGAEATRVFSAAEQLRIATWLSGKGLPGPGAFEAQLDYVQRIQQLLNAQHSVDYLLRAVDDEMRVMR